MDVFCGKCQKTVGKVDDSKIVPGRKVTVSCPHCGEKITLSNEPSPPVLEPDSPAAGGETPPLPPGGGEKDVPRQSGELSVGRVLDEAWQRTRGLKGPVWGSYILLVLAVIVINVVVGVLGGILGHGAMAAGFAVAVQLTVSLVTYPFMAGIMMMGVYRAVDREVSYRMAFDFFGFFVPIILATILVALLTMVGFIFLVIPGIYLSVAYLCVLPLIIDKKMGVWQAMETSRKGIGRKWFTVFIIYLVLGFIVMLSAIPLGIGLIWTVPMMIAASGVIYRDLFGVSEA